MNEQRSFSLMNFIGTLWNGKIMHEDKIINRLFHCDKKAWSSIIALTEFLTSVLDMASIKVRDHKVPVMVGCSGLHSGHQEGAILPRWEMWGCRP